MYVSKIERNLAYQRFCLREAQHILVSARCVGDPTMIGEAEQHVGRMLNYVWNAQQSVLRHAAKPKLHMPPYVLYGAV